MFTNLQQMVRRFVNRVQASDGKSRAPVPPVRTPLRAPKRTAEANPVAKPAKTSDVDAPVLTRQPQTITRVVSRGNNKNVFVQLRPGQTIEDALKMADDAPPPASLEILPDDGLDPYNSGAYSTRQIWNDPR